MPYFLVFYLHAKKYQDPTAENKQKIMRAGYQGVYGEHKYGSFRPPRTLLRLLDLHFDIEGPFPP